MSAKCINVNVMEKTQKNPRGYLVILLEVHRSTSAKSDPLSENAPFIYRVSNHVLREDAIDLGCTPPLATELCSAHTAECASLTSTWGTNKFYLDGLFIRHVCLRNYMTASNVQNEVGQSHKYHHHTIHIYMSCEIIAPLEYVGWVILKNSTPNLLLSECNHYAPRCALLPSLH